MKRSFGLLTVLLLTLTCPLRGAQGDFEKKVMQKVRYTSGDLRDPFQSPFEPEEAPYRLKPEPELPKPIKAPLPGLEVQGMIWSSKMPQAIINNTVLRIGDVIEGAEISDIRKEGIYILYEGNEYLLRPAALEIY